VFSDIAYEFVLKSALGKGHNLVFRPAEIEGFTPPLFIPFLAGNIYESMPGITTG
jgi:hypothetical protein